MGISISSAYQYKNLDDGWVYNTDPIKFLSGTYTLWPVAIGYTSWGINPTYKLDVVGWYINSSSGLCINGDCKSAWSQVGTQTQWITSWSTISYTGTSVGIWTSSPQNGVLDISWSIALNGFRTITFNSGTDSIGFWKNALNGTSTGIKNIAIGYNALSSNLGGSWNTVIGYQGMTYNTTGYDNTAIGYQSLFSNTTGFQNTAIGEQTLFSNTTGRRNNAIWYQALFSNTTGNNNISIGEQSLYSNTTWIDNLAIWYQALYLNSTGWSNNTAIGDSSLYSNTNGTYNTAIGKNSLYSNTTGDYNFALGFDSLSSNDVGSYNTAIGTWALSSNTAWSNNVAIGWSALNMNDIWDDNVAIGESALMNNVIWHSNTAIGNWAWSAINGNSWVIDGFSNTFIGHYATAYTGNIENATAIGANALITDSNTVIIGSISWSNNATETVNVWIWTSSPSERLEVAWNIRATAYLYSSDERLKKDIYSITGALDKVLKLDGVHFTWIETQDESYGFIAQSIEKVFPELVATSSKTGMKSVQYANLLAPVINAMKELYELYLSQAKRIDEQERRIQDMEKQIQALMNQINAQNITQ